VRDEKLASGVALSRRPLPAAFDPDRLDVSSALVRRRVRSILRGRPATDDEKTALEEVVRINEADLRLAVAIEDGAVDSARTESVTDELDARLEHAVSRLSPLLQEVAFNLCVPQWVDGSSCQRYSSWPKGARLRWPRARPRSTSRSTRKTHTRRARARSPGSSSDDDPEHDRVAPGALREAV
jgi:hypothetical protein